MANSCEIRGNADLFGIGVRIGSYLQWLTLIIANVVAPTSVPEISRTIAVFQLAFLCALAWNALANTDQTYDVEAFIVTAFGVGGGLTITSIRNNGCVTRLTIGVTYMLALGFYAFSVWLWSVGLNRLLHMHGHLRYFGLVTSVLATIGSAVMLVRLILGLWYNREHWRPWILNPTSEPNLAHSSMQQHKIVRYAIRAAQLVALATLVTVVELTISWNGVVGVNDLMQTGQLIPFVVGCGVLGNIIWSCIFQTPDSMYQ
uniref:Uncharacterized protein n=1 Tax=Bionectria ochroleuca TaxID=29856 RepID=A0A0B7KAJ8_BIOOC